uniref:Uncharacterized protein n=1 Tax=Salix viminalis TaxID=40686 RepID=A0A6N2KF84_SALVM
MIAAKISKPGCGSAWHGARDRISIRKSKNLHLEMTSQQTKRTLQRTFITTPNTLQISFHLAPQAVRPPLSNLFLPFASSASLISSFPNLSVNGLYPVKEVTNKAEAPQSCPVIDEKAATTEEPEVVVQDDDDEEEEVKNDSDEEQAEEKLEEYSPITGEDEPNTTFDDEVEADDGDLI